MSYIFLASPYSDPDPQVRQYRYQRALVAVHWMLTRKLWVYSPIVHNHFLAEGYKLPMGGDFWIPYSNAMLEGACALWILDIDGARTSKGIEQETNAAERLNLRCDYLYPKAGGGYIHPAIPKELTHEATAI